MPGLLLFREQLWGALGEWNILDGPISIAQRLSWHLFHNHSAVGKAEEQAREGVHDLSKVTGRTGLLHQPSATLLFT